MAKRAYKMRWTLIGHWDEECRHSLNLAIEWWTALHDYEDWLFEGIHGCLSANDVMSKIYVTDPEFPEEGKMSDWIGEALSGEDGKGNRRPEFIAPANGKLLRLMNERGLLLFCESETDLRDEEKFTGHEKRVIIRSNGNRFFFENE